MDTTALRTLMCTRIWVGALADRWGLCGVLRKRLHCGYRPPRCDVDTTHPSRMSRYQDARPRDEVFVEEVIQPTLNPLPATLHLETPKPCTLGGRRGKRWTD